VTGFKRKLVHGAAVMLAGQGAKFVLQLGALTALGRLLRPDDFGLVAMVAPVSVFIALFNDLGLSQATVQRKEISPAQMTALFWLNLAVSCVLALGTFFVAPAIGQFYGDPRTADLMVAYGGLLIFGGLSAQHIAFLNRQLRFEMIAALDVGALLAGVAAGITVAWFTHSYWALVAMQGVTSAVTAALAWAVSGWRPQLPRRAEDVGQLVRFGANLTGFNIINFFARNLDDILIGKVWGAHGLGLYSQAYKLLMLPLYQISYPISRIAVPVLSRLAQEPGRYRSAYLQMIEKVLLVTMPGMVLLIVMADKVVLLLLGPQWDGVVPIFHWLGASALVGTIGNSTGWLFISQNRTGEMLRWGVVGSALIVGSFVVGLPYGPVGVAASYVLVGCLVHGPLLCWAVTRRGPIRLADIARTTLTFAISAVASAGAIYGVRHVVGGLVDSDPLVILVACAPLSYAVSLAVLTVLPTERNALTDAFEIVQLLVRHRPAHR
jgi:PST family polysaccharide transporter